MSKKITQASARQTRRELKALQEKFRIYVRSPHPGSRYYNITVSQSLIREAQLTNQLGFDTAFRLDEATQLLKAFAVRRT